MNLSPPLAAERHWLPVPQRGSSRSIALASALAHGALLAVLFRVAAPTLPAPPPMTAMTMLFTAPARVSAPPAAPIAAPLAPPVQPTTAPTQATPVARQRTKRALPRVVRTEPAAPASIAAAGRPAAATQAAPPAGDSTFLLARFTSDIQAVVRAAAIMPAAARRQHREGRAEVRFDYVDGAVHGVALAQSSASRLLDNAALSAVQTAHYPPPPPQLRGRPLSLVVWIDFHLESPG